MTDVEAYRRLSEDIASAIAVVTTRSGRWDVAATIDSFLDVSYDPPTMLLSLYGQSRICEALEDSGSCVLNVLADTQRDLSDRFGTPGLPLQGMLTGVPHERDASGNAILTGALAHFSLDVQSVHSAATHQLFVCSVTRSLPGSGRRPAIRYSQRHHDLA